MSTTRDQPEERSGIGSFVRGGSLSIVGFAAGALLQFALVLIATRGLKPGLAGTFFEGVALVTMLGQWGQLGVSTAFERLIPKARVEGSGGDVRVLVLAGLVPIALVGAIMLVLDFAAAPTLASVLYSDSHAREGLVYLRILLPMVPALSLSAAALSATRGWGTMRSYVGIQNVAIPALRPALLVVALALDPSPLALALAWSVPLLLGLVVSLGILRTFVRRAVANLGSTPSQPIGRLLADFWRFAAPRGLSAGFLVTVTWLDVVLVGAIRGPRDAAIYTATSSLAVVGSYALQAVGFAIAPQFSFLLTQRDRSAVAHLFRVSTSWMILIAWPAYIVLAIHPSIVLRLFGPSYGSGSLALLILAIAGLVNVATGNVTVLLLMAGHSGWGLVNAAAALAVNVLLNLLLIPRYGFTGAAVAWAVSIVVNNLSALAEVAIFVKLRPFGTGYRLATAAGVFGLVPVLLLDRFVAGDAVAGFILALLAGMCLYVYLVYRWRAALELDLVMQAMRRVVSIRAFMRLPVVPTSYPDR